MGERVVRDAVHFDGRPETTHACIGAGRFELEDVSQGGRVHGTVLADVDIVKVAVDLQVAGQNNSGDEKAVRCERTGEDDQELALMTSFSLRV